MIRMIRFGKSIAVDSALSLAALALTILTGRRRRKEIEMESNWQYSGDVNLLYGGTFVRDQGHYFDIVEVTDLGSACGADDLYLLDIGNTSHEYYNRQQISTALESCGPGRSMYKLGETTRQRSRLLIARALWDYGNRDIDRSVVLFDADNGSDCVNCGEPIVYRNGQCQHADAIDPKSAEPEYVKCCAEDGRETGKNAEPPKPKRFENGAESWPDMLAKDWADYADGETGTRRYLADHCDIPLENA